MGAPNWTGNFSLTTTYNTDDVAFYAGSSWISLVSSNTGNVPGQTEQWTLFAIAGQNTPFSQWRGSWASNTSYAAFDSVSYNGSSYASLIANNGGNIPSSSPSQWALIAAQGGQGGIGTFTFDGQWGPSVQYETNNIVSFGGSTYIATGTPVEGSNPTVDITHWMLMASIGAPGSTGPQGVQGVQGLGFTWRGPWVSTTAYYKNDVVGLLGNSYVSLTGNTGINPSTDGGTNWQTMAKGSIPGGSPGNVQGNNSGIYGGLSGSTIDFVNGLLTLAPTGTGVALTVKGDLGGGNILDLYLNGDGSPSAQFFPSELSGGIELSMSDSSGDNTEMAPGVLAVQSIVYGANLYFEDGYLAIDGATATNPMTPTAFIVGDAYGNNIFELFTQSYATLVSVDQYGETSITPSGMSGATGVAALTITGDAKGDDIMTLYTVGNASMALAIGADGFVTHYNGVATVGSGIPAEYAEIDLTPQSAPISAAALYMTVAAGQYRICWNAKVTTPDSSGSPASTLGGTTGFQVAYKDADDAVLVMTPTWWGGGNNGMAPSSANGNSTQTWVGGEFTVNAAAASAIEYSFGYATAGSGATAMLYTLHVRVEAL